jgi:DNA polymerase-1
VAGQVYGVSLDQVSREMRSSAKAINFGIIYGQSAFGLARALNIDKGTAAEFIEAYFARFPGVSRFIEETLDTARASGQVTTILGRRRSVQGVRARQQRAYSRQRNMPERIAVNTVIQGSAADLIKLAMIRVHRRLKTSGLAARLLLQIHDELVFEAPAEELDALATLAREEMTAARQLRTPLQVDIKTGDNWAQCEPM